MKNKKLSKLFISLFALPLFLTGCNTASNSSEYYNIQGLEFFLTDDNTYYVSQGTSTLLSNIVIPSTHNGLPVTGITDYGFQNSKAKSIEIPDSVTSIGNSAFSWCSSLISIAIGNGVISIGSSAFYNCSNLTNVFYGGSKSQWNSIDIGSDNDYLINANIEYNSEVNQLTNVVTSKYSYILIDDNKVYGFTMIDKTITSFDFEEELPGLTIVSLGTYAFYNCTSLTSIVIPDSVTSIGYEAFESCKSITSITIPDSVTSIDSSAFRNCSSLTSIVIPDSVTSIGSNAFYNCTSLTSISIPNSVTSIGEAAFYGCSKLTSIVIPDSITSISDYAFYSCSKLSNVFYGGSKSQWNSIDIGSDNYYLKDANIEYNTEVNQLTNVVTSKYSYTLIDDNKVYGFTMIDKTITSFDFEEELPGLTIVSLGTYAFYNCTSLTSIEIPDSVTSIGEGAFYYCTSLTSITFEGTMEEWNLISKGTYWRLNVPATVVHCSDGDVNI